MANAEINDLTEKTSPAETDELEIQETSGGLSKKVTRANLVPDSSETVKGKVELATTGEATTGTDTARAVTPAGVKAVADTKANTSHSHASSDVTSGLLANARIATGTPDGSKFLRDDQVWTAIPGGGDALTANPLSQFAATTSAQLRGVLSDESGTGPAVFGTSPNITTPTGIVKSDVGLGSVDNTSDAGKPVSTATQTALDAKQDLDSDLTSIAGLSPTNDDVIQRKAGAWTNRTMAQVKTDLSLVKGDVGLGNVDNTSDANKPVSTAQQTAIDGKVADAINDSTTTIAPSQNAVFDALALKQPLDADLTALAGLSGVQGDIIYRDSSQWQRLPKGTASQQVRMNSGATAPEWFTATGGGQTLFEAIVAASGGDYTTLGAAITGGAKRIYVKNGTYTESAITLASGTNNDTVIIGESPTTTVLSFSSNVFTNNSLRLKIANIGMDFTTGGFSNTAVDCDIEGCKFTKSGATTALIQCTSAGTAMRFSNNRCVSTATTAYRPFDFNAPDTRCIGNYFKYRALQSFSFLFTNGTGDVGESIFANNQVIDDGSGTSILIYFNGQYVNITGNTFFSTASNTRAVELDPLNATFTNNVIRSKTIGLYVDNSGNADISGNAIHCSGTSGEGIFLTGSQNCSISANQVNLGGSNTSNGISVASAYTAISANSVYKASASGTCIRTSGQYNTVTGNNTRAGAIGIEIANSDCTISGNNTSTSPIGIQVNSSQSNNIVTGNNTPGATTGISIGSSGVNNSVTNNNVIGPTTAISDSGTATDIMNNVGVSQLFDKRFLRMKNTSGSTVAAGGVVTFKAVAAGDEVTTTATASDALVYGVASASINNNSYGYIQVLGKTTLLKVDGTTDIAVGDFLTTFTTAGIAKKAAPATLGVTLGDLAFAIALEAYTTDDSSGVLDALIINPRRL